MIDSLLSLDPKLVTLMQFVSSTLLAVASLVVAVVAVRFGYRNNFGWKPIALISSHGFRGGPSLPDHYEIMATIDVWNRRKYPIVLEGIDFTCGNLKLEEFVKGYAYDKAWHFYRGGLHRRPKQLLEPSTQMTFTAVSPFRKRTLDDLNEPLAVKVYYFDPKRNRYESAAANCRFELNPSMPRLTSWLHRLRQVAGFNSRGRNGNDGGS